jgi:hypothetical protein
MDAFIGSIAQLAPAGPVIIGGLAVMSRVGGEHRPTLDIDSAFNNETDTPTTTVLIADGIATGEDTIQRVRIDDALVDVIDTFPIEPDDLPDDSKDRLFVCAHRYAYETATPVDFVGDTNRVTVRVATVEGLIAMKSHALRFGRPERRRLKRASDLYDVVRLTTAGTADLLVGSPWDLRNQVRAALAADLADLPAAAAVLQGSAVQAIRDISPDLLDLVTGRLLARLSE